MGEISVNNLDVIGYLLCRGFTATRLEQSGKIVFFIFADPENTAKLEISKYHKGAMVPARDFVAAMREAKDLMFTLKRQNSSEGRHENDYTHELAGR
jgi:hypothetical protein